MASFSTREQRAIIKLLTAKGENPISIHQQLVTVSKTAVMDVKNVRKWQKLFRNGRESCDDATRSGRPVTSTTDAVVAVEQLIMKDRRITVDEIATAMGISHGTAHTILHEKLNMNKVSARWVPRQLTLEHKNNRLDMCASLLIREGQDTNYSSRSGHELHLKDCHHG